MYFTVTVLQTRRDHIQRAFPLVSMDIALTGKVSGTILLQWMSRLKFHGQGQAQSVYMYLLEVRDMWQRITLSVPLGWCVGLVVACGLACLWAVGFGWCVWLGSGL